MSPLYTRRLAIFYLSLYPSLRKYFFGVVYAYAWHIFKKKLGLFSVLGMSEPENLKPKLYLNAEEKKNT